MSENKNLEKLFGITPETLEKSRDIKPILDLTELEVNSSVKIIFTEDMPKEVDTPNSKYSKTSKVISVKDVTNGEDEALEYSLFLSSKSLALGVAKVWEKHDYKLKGVKVLIKKSVTIYKKHGENTVYNVHELI